MLADGAAAIDALWALRSRILWLLRRHAHVVDHGQRLQVRRVFATWPTTSTN